MSLIVADVIALIHVVFVAAMVWAPFARSPVPRVMFLVFVPVLWVHWALGDSTCVLTLLECWVRGVPSTRSFVHRLVAPLYDIPDSTVRTLSWTVTVMLWVHALRRTTVAEVASVFGGQATDHSSDVPGSSNDVSAHSAYSSTWRA